MEDTVLIAEPSAAWITSVELLSIIKMTMAYTRTFIFVKGTYTIYIYIYIYIGNSVNFHDKKGSLFCRKKQCREAIIFVSVFLHLSTNRCICASF